MPEARGKVLPVQSRVAPDLYGITHAEGDVEDAGVGQGEGDGGGRQGGAVGLADVGDGTRAVDELGRGGLVVVLHAFGGAIAREQAGVEDADGHDALAVFLSGGQDVVQARLVEEGVAAGQHHHVGGGLAQEAGEHGGLVHARADRTDDALVAQRGEGGHGFVGGLSPVVVGVVEVDDVEPVQAGAGEGVVDGAQDAVTAEVPLAAQVVTDDETLGVDALRVLVGDEEAAGLGGDDVLVAGAVAQGGAQPVFGQAQAVVRRGVVIADARVPGGVQGGGGVLGGGGAVEVADDGGAEAELGELHGGAGDLSAVQGVLLKGSFSVGHVPWRPRGALRPRREWPWRRRPAWSW